MTLSNLESTIFIGDKTFKGALQMDANPGPEKSSSTPGDWTAGANWAFAGTVCTHTAGATATLSRDTSEVANEIYRVVFPVAARTAGSVTMSIGGVSGTARSSNATFTEYIVATGTGNLTFTPSSDFDGNIDIASVSVKRVAVVAADRVTMWVGDRIAAGVEAAGDAGLFVRSEDGTLNFIGDRWGIGTAEPKAKFDISGSNAELLFSTTLASGQYSGLHYTDDEYWRFGTKNYDGTVYGWRVTFPDNDSNRVFDIQGVDGTGAVTRTVFRANGIGTILVNATAAYGRNSQKLEVNQSADEGGAALNTWSATAAEAAMLDFNRSKSATIGTQTVVASGDVLGFLTFRGSDGTAFIEGAQIRAEVDGTPGTNDMPGRLVFYTTADGAASVTEKLRIDNAGDFTFFDGGDFILGSTTGTKIGTATTQKLAFYNATPVVQGLAVADASGGATIDAEARTAINALLARIRTLGLIAT